MFSQAERNVRASMTVCVGPNSQSSTPKRAHFFICRLTVCSINLKLKRIQHVRIKDFKILKKLKIKKMKKKKNTTVGNVIADVD